jgi:hypothetical protein
VHWLDQFQRAIGTEEKVPPGEKTLISREGEIVPFRA